MIDKRFVIKPSSIVTDCFVIIDKEKKYTFPVLDSTLNHMFCKSLNELHEENENLKDVNVQCCNDYSAMRRDVLRYKKENEQLKQSNERIVKDIDLALGFIRHKGYSLQDIKDYEDAKKEYEEDLAYYRKGDVE